MLFILWLCIILSYVFFSRVSKSAGPNTCPGDFLSGTFTLSKNDLVKKKVCTCTLLFVPYKGSDWCRNERRESYTCTCVFGRKGSFSLMCCSSSAITYTHTICTIIIIHYTVGSVSSSVYSWT